jgi:hypothetical protein
MTNPSEHNITGNTRTSCLYIAAMAKSLAMFPRAINT